jgi:hypothetical protein
VSAAAVGLPLLASLVLACGGSTDEPRPEGSPERPLPGYLAPPLTSSGSASGSASSCTPPPDVEFFSIEDFEFGAGGGFFVSNDVCNVCQDFVNQSNAINNAGQASQRAAELAQLAAQLESCRPSCDAVTRSPYFFESPRVAEPIEGGRCGSRFAMHIAGGPYVDWGGNMRLGFATPINVSSVEVVDELTGLPRPALDFDGVSFWGRLGGPGGNNLRVEVAEKHTADNYTGGPNGGPICMPNTTDANSELGCDQFGATAQLRGSWQLFLIPFAEMRQGGWGRPSQEFDLTGLMALSISYPQGSWDFWVDDVAFYRQERR